MIEQSTQIPKRVPWLYLLLPKADKLVHTETVLSKAKVVEPHNLPMPRPQGQT